MAHKKAGSGQIRQGNNIVGKRLGLKVTDGQFIQTGTIIVRQRGNVFFPGNNVKQARDFSLYASANGTVRFRNMTKNRRGKKSVDIIPSD